ncbi:hypothetical protein [Lacrimispora indolis]|uniref:hypothetical protein n=1 Tax=Lacrimispora indolis TaxID=69825 RepID=UPI00045EC2FF|nr:hypothetical protein [Lacrimispora indolis]
MKGILDATNVRITRLSPKDGKQYFFGYYDIPAFHPYKKLHLCHQVSFMDRLPELKDVCRLGVLDMGTGEFKELARTTAWNFQQGAMLQWNPLNYEEIIYNIYENGNYRGMIKNIKTGAERRLDRPVTNVSPDGRWGLSVNMSRIYDFRPGYGYCNQKDPLAGVHIPGQDGVFLIDMQTGQSKLILNYRQINDALPQPWSPNKKIVINHITFNRESDRFLFLVRVFPEADGEWKTALGTSDLHGNVYPLRPYAYASHYHWGIGGRLMIYGGWGNGAGLYILQDETQQEERYDSPLFRKDIHCSYSPDGEWVIGDGYQDEKEYRPVYLYHIESKQGMMIGRFHSPYPPITDIRCDLHCRWSPESDTVSFDSIHEGFRGIYRMELIDAMKEIRKLGGI